MRTLATFLGILTALSAVSAFAANSVIIEQMGPGSVEIDQSGTDNSADIHQVPGDPTPLPPKPADHQNAVLSNPLTSDRARMQSLTHEPDAGQQTAAPKKADNTIHIYQQGDKNKATTAQEGTNNDLQVNQQGTSNEVTRTQAGNHNHSRIIENGDVIEDKQTDQ